jgi:hypothetical protein
MPAPTAKGGLRVLRVQSMGISRVRQFRSALAILPFDEDPGAGMGEVVVR